MRHVCETCHDMGSICLFGSLLSRFIVEIVLPEKHHTIAYDGIPQRSWVFPANFPKGQGFLLPFLRVCHDHAVNSLGGNCKTTMMAMISPALESMVETLSTVKFASRAKNIKNQPIVNEDFDQKVSRLSLQGKIYPEELLT